jgi:hypothetical protein
LSHFFKSVLSWTGRLQGDYVLPTARTIYLGIACLSLLAAAIGLVVALLMQVLSMGGPSHERVPFVADAPALSIDVDAVGAHLRPPHNIRFVFTRGTLHEQPSTSDFLGYFDADTANGLPKYPDDFSIIGGRDAELFERVSVSIPNGTRAGLAPTQALIARLGADPMAYLQPRSHSFQLRVLARDAYGNSAAADVIVSLRTGPVPLDAAAPAPAPQVEETTDLQRLASEIAAKADPTHGAAFFDIYKRAQRVPADCGADEGTHFVGEYRRAFEATRSLIVAGNTEAFFAGVCDAWRQALAKHATELAQAELARNEAIARNQTAEFRHAIKVAGTKSIRNLALGLVGSAIVAFITICLFLAFLAMENHTKAVREAIEAMVDAQRANRRPAE